MTSSNGALLKAALYSALSALPALSGVQVTYGEPVSYDAPDVLGILDSSGSSVLGTIATNRNREETIQQRFMAGSFSGDATQQQTVTERAFALMDAAIDYCRLTDPTVGGTVRSMIPDVEWELNEANGEKGCIAELNFTLTFNVRIS